MTNELEFTKKIFFQDAKNYHAWSHRQVVFLSLYLFRKSNDIACLEKLSLHELCFMVLNSCFRLFT